MSGAKGSGESTSASGSGSSSADTKSSDEDDEGPPKLEEITDDDLKLSHEQFINLVISRNQYSKLQITILKSHFSET